MRRIERIRKRDGMRSYDSNPAYPSSSLLTTSAWWYKMPLFIHAVLLTSSIAIRFLSGRIGCALFTCLLVRCLLSERRSSFGAEIEQLVREIKGKSWVVARYFNERRVISNPLSGATAESFSIFLIPYRSARIVKLITW